ncbi:MAG TPA: DUF3800 domain-containing protein [Baekduia sp.]
MWFFYVDDSGDERQVMLTAIGVRATDWKPALKSWLDWRRSMFRLHGLPAGFELHAQKFVTGRGDPATAPIGRPKPRINVDKSLRRAIYADALQVISSLPAKVFTVHRDDTDKMAAYCELLRRVEQLLAATDELGVMVVDGLDEGHRAEHRELTLASRHVLEDPWMQPAHASQLIQIADLLAHAAFQAVVRNPARRFMWTWYAEIVGPILVPLLDDVHRHEPAETTRAPGQDPRARRR